MDEREDEQRRLLGEALKRAGLTGAQLWLHYFSLGGDAGEYEVDAYIHGSLSLPVLQRDLLAHAANELIAQQPRPYAPYHDEVTATGPAGPEDVADGRGWDSGPGRDAGFPDPEAETEGGFGP